MNDVVRILYSLALSTRDSIRIGVEEHPMPLVKRRYMDNVLEHHLHLTHSKEFLRGQWCVYMLRLKDDTYYTGITNNIYARLEKHRSGHGSKYVRSRLPLSVIYLELVADRSTASQIECRIKKLSKEAKCQLRTSEQASTIICECSCGFVMRMPYNTVVPQPLICVACAATIYITEELSHVRSIPRPIK